MKKKLVHTPGPVAWQDYGLPGEYYGLYGARAAVIRGKDNGEDGTTVEVLPGDARFLRAAYNAFDSAARALNCNAVELAERMQDGEIATLVESLKDVVSRFHSCIADGNGNIAGDEEAMTKAGRILDKVKGIPQ